MDYTGKLDTAKCKQLIIELLSNIDSTELSDELSEVTDDPVEQATLKSSLLNTKDWKRESKALISSFEVDMFKSLLGITPVHTTGYVRYFQHSECEGRATVYQLNDNRVFIELELG